jgi:ferritin-like metal-binding protein YciE
MATAEERLMEWLRDAHAMEAHAETMLNTLAQRTGGYPELKAQVERHLTETSRQAEDIRTCIARRGGDTSVVRDWIGKFVAISQGLGGMLVSDEIVKAAVAAYTFEHMEIACYNVLIATADSLGDVETKVICERILQEEEAMADWLARHLDSTTVRYLGFEDMAVTATP